jgi:hypothetical protein
MSSGSPSSHAANPGDERPLIRIARSMRSAGGKNVSTGITPTMGNGGLCTCATSSAMPMSRYSCHAFCRIVASSTCSRLRTGSASIPRRASSPATAAPTRSHNASASSRVPGGGAASDRRTVSGRPAVLPGV